jgi:hypothetical protein
MAIIIEPRGIKLQMNEENYILRSFTLSSHNIVRVIKLRSTDYKDIARSRRT